MFTGIEKFLFDKFRGMPLWVRVLTYLFMLFLFGYLLLIPRFINGQLIGRDEGTEGFVPYRGVELRISVDGRDYKFKSNEDGFWSIPLVSRLPGPVDVQVYHEDLHQWFEVKFDATTVFKEKSHRIVIGKGKPFVKLLTDAKPHSIVETVLVSARRLVGYLIPNAIAGLVIPTSPPSAVESPRSPSKSPAPARLPAGESNTVEKYKATPTPSRTVPVKAISQPSGATENRSNTPSLTVTSPSRPQTAPTTSRPSLPPEAKSIEKNVTSTIADVLKKSSADINLSFPWSGEFAPSYIQRIQIIDRLEKNYSFRIPDEHWRVMSTVYDLVDYVYKRQELKKSYPKLSNDPKASWPEIQQSFPANDRPVFK